MSEVGARRDCRKCGRRRAIECFGLHAEGPGGFRAWCRECEAGSAKERQPYNRRYRAEKRVKIDAIKAASGCARCGEINPACLQFHHRDPKQKDRSISRFYSGTWSWDRVLEEIAKCDVLCANCHLKLHRELDNENRIA